MDDPIVRWRPAQTGAHKPAPIVVLLHGRGADENDLFQLTPAIDPAFAVASVRAPLAAGNGGYTWSESGSPGRYVAKSLRRSIDWLQAWLETLESADATAPEIYLLGFSAGMAMASALLLDRPSRFRGTILLSGTLPFDGDLPITNGRLAGAPVFYGRGTFDTAIPADLVSRTEAYLHAASGARLTARTYPIAHEINLPELEDIAAWLATFEFPSEFERTS